MTAAAATPQRTKRAVRLALLLVVLGTLAASAPLGAAPTGVGGGMPPGGAHGSDPHGLSALSGFNPVVLEQGGAAGLVQSGHSLADVDPFSGALMGTDAAAPLSNQQALQADLIDQGVLRVDHEEIAQLARDAADRRRGERGGVAVERDEDPGAPEDWELSSFSGDCHPANAEYQARHETVELFERMCRDAADDGVTLQIVSAYRDPQHQRRLYLNAVERYGSADAARRWVAYSDGEQCTSRHCAGTAIDVDLSQPGAREWLHQPVGCWSQTQGLTMGQTNCGSGETQVIQANLYGLVIPLDHEPWHVEVGVPVASEAGGASCHPPASMQVPAMVANIFRCRLQQEGYTPAEADRVAAEAVVVSRCESNWNPQAVVFAGRYTDQPHPRTGMRYTAAGVFQFIESSADRWVDGGYANVDDPVANINAAVDYYLQQRRQGNRGWEPWECAAVNGDFKDNSVLPGWPGGPSELPSWAWQY